MKRRWLPCGSAISTTCSPSCTAMPWNSSTSSMYSTWNAHVLHTNTTRTHTSLPVWPGSEMLGCWTRDSKRCGFKSRLFCFQVTTLRKLFTHVPLSLTQQPLYPSSLRPPTARNKSIHKLRHRALPIVPSGSIGVMPCISLFPGARESWVPIPRKKKQARECKP